MDGFYGLAVARDRQNELLREAAEWRLVQRLRKARRESENGRIGPSRGAEIEVRWGLVEDEAEIAELLDMNGMPRWLAFEERFLVAEVDGRVMGALRYRTESKRLVLGVLVADPWAGERRLAGALYAGARRLGREIGVGEILAARIPHAAPHADYPREAGYRRRGRFWRLDATQSAGAGSSKERGARHLLTAPFDTFLRLLSWR